MGPLDVDVKKFVKWLLFVGIVVGLVVGILVGVALMKWFL